MLVYRFDYLALRYHIPFIPYFKIGLAYYIWEIDNGGGFLSVAQFTPPGTTQRQGGWGGTLLPLVARFYWSGVARMGRMIRCFRRAISRKRLVVIRCSHPSNVPGM